MKLFNLDLHVSVIKDLMDIFGAMGHQVDHWSISSHSWVHGWETATVDVVNQYTWRHLNGHMCKRFYERYKSELEQYDAFIVTHTPAFSLLYQEFNKPVITVASTRYEAPFTLSARHWEWLNRSIQQKSVQKMMQRVANNKYDQLYCERYTGLRWKHIPSYCGHVSERWAPELPAFLLDSRELTFRLRQARLVHKSTLGRYQWSDLVRYAGIVVIPYNVSVMSVFEYYTACIPLFFPSKKFCLELYRQYAGLGVLSEVSWLQVQETSAPPAIHGGDADPNLTGQVGVLEHWINFCDWYDEGWMPHITFFESFSDLDEQLRSADLAGISENMRRHNIVRKQKIEALWTEQLSDINKSNT